MSAQCFVVDTAEDVEQARKELNMPNVQFVYLHNVDLIHSLGRQVKFTHYIQSTVDAVKTLPYVQVWEASDDKKYYVLEFLQDHRLVHAVCLSRKYGLFRTRLVKHEDTVIAPYCHPVIAIGIGYGLYMPYNQQYYDMFPLEEWNCQEEDFKYLKFDIINSYLEDTIKPLFKPT